MSLRRPAERTNSCRKGDILRVKRVVFLASLGWACALPAADFREFSWGEPIAAIQGAEAAWPVFATDSLLEYDTEYAGRRTMR
jgi:hypothetical protein